MKQEEIRSRLIDGTIHVIARDGLDKATTKLIGEETSINQAYIYRCFEGKEDMFARAFDALDVELADKVMQHMPVMYMQEMEYEMCCRFFFLQCGNSCWATAINVLLMCGITILPISLNIPQKITRSALFCLLTNLRMLLKMKRMCG